VTEGAGKQCCPNTAASVAADDPHRELVAFVYARRLHGRGAGWTDIHLLASAVIARVRFWTADHALSILAEELGLAYLPPRPPLARLEIT